MDIQHIKYFLEVAKCKSFSKAAERLYVTQPILTRCIKNMEKELMVPLIMRSTKSFALTDAGEALFIYGSQLVEQYEDIFRHIQDIKEPKVGELRISSPGTLLDIYFSRLVMEYREQYPGIRINISEKGSVLAAKDVLDGISDIALVMLPLENTSNLNIFPIIYNEVRIWVHKNHPLAKEQFIEIKQLQGVEIITYNQDATLCNALIQKCQEEGFQPNIFCQVMAPKFILDVLSRGTSVGVFPGPMFCQFQAEELVSVPIRPDFPWKIAIVTKKGRYLPNATSSFLGFAQNYFKNIEP